MTKKVNKSVPLHPDQTVSKALQQILSHTLEYLLQWEDKARTWENIEGVHQMRVAFRRMRSVLQVFRSAMPKDAGREWAEEMRWLANQLGPARDLDVFIDEGLGAVSGKLSLPGADALAAIACERRQQAYVQVNGMLDGDRYAAFKRRFPQWVESEGWRRTEAGDKTSAKLDRPVIPFARRLLDKQERLVLKAGSHVDRDSAEEMHELRIRCKKLRYATEFFQPLFPGMNAYIEHMKGLQDLLGVMNDITVMEHILDELLDAAPAAEIAMYAGGLVGWRTRQFFEIKDSFGERWEELVDAKHPWWK
jgi:CHAD domain-containing protein